MRWLLLFVGIVLVVRVWFSAEYALAAALGLFILWGLGKIIRYISGRVSGPPRGKTHVYHLKDAAGRTRYVGITNNPKRRAKEHKRAGRRGSLKVVKTVSSRAKARRIERRHIKARRRLSNKQHNRRK